VVEQLGPNLWHGYVYEEHPAIIQNETSEAISLTPDALVIICDRFTCLSEECVKRCAIASMYHRSPGLSVGDERWQNDSDIDKNEWRDKLASLRFPGYLEREGLARF
jgi:hypothetical protein